LPRSSPTRVQDRKAFGGSQTRRSSIHDVKQPALAGRSTSYRVANGVATLTPIWVKCQAWLERAACPALTATAPNAFRFGRYLRVQSRLGTIRRPTMHVARWGNSLAVRLPKAVVEALDLKEGDDRVAASMQGDGNIV